MAFDVSATEQQDAILQTTSGCPETANRTVLQLTWGGGGVWQLPVATATPSYGQWQEPTTP